MNKSLEMKPYLIRAIYEWCIAYNYTPYILAKVDQKTIVPFDYVQNGLIVLDIGMIATNHIVLGNRLIEFQAMFNGILKQISIPINMVKTIYSYETGHGMDFEIKTDNYDFDAKLSENSEKSNTKTSNNITSNKNTIPYLSIVKNI